MPPHIVGQLVQENATSYVLSNVLDAVMDEEQDMGYRVVERKFPDFISRTYVWRVEMLGIKPDIEDFGSMHDVGGGMG